MKKTTKLREEIGNRTHYVKIRLNDVEIDFIRKKCITHKLMMAEYIRRVVFKDFEES